MKIGTGLKFTISSLIQTISGMIISLVALSLIGPDKIGLWHAALILKPYLNFAQLGLTEGLGRELPFYLGRNDNKKVKQYASNAQLITILYAILTITISIFLMAFYAVGLQEKLIFLTAGIFISTMFVDNYLSSTYRSSKSFKDLSKVYVLVSVLGLTLIPLIYFFNFKGYLILLSVQSIFSTTLLIFFRPFRIKSIFNKVVYLKNIKIGFPMLSLNFLRNIPDTYPKIIILFFISTTALGVTAPANAVLMAFGMLPAALAKYIYPTMTYDYGKDGDRIKLWGKIKRICGYLLMLGCVGLLSSFLIPWGINNFFPKYQEAIYITIIATGIGFLRMFSIIFNVFNTLKSYGAQFKVSIIRNASYLIFPACLYFLFSKDDPLLIIFIGILFAELISNIFMFYYVYKVTHIKTITV